MQPAVASLLTVLEQTQTSKEVGADSLFKYLTLAEAAFDAQPVFEPADLQRTVSVVCSWLRAHEDFRDDLCVRLLLKMLAKLLGQDPAADNIAIQKGLISSTAVLLQQRSGDGLMVKCCLEIVAMLSVVENSDQIISRTNLMSSIVELLTKHSTNTAVLEDAITTLALMAKRTRHRRAMQQTGCITVLVDLLKRYITTPTMVVAVCRFLGNFAVKEDCCVAVLRSGGIDALMAAFDNSAPLQGMLTQVDMRAAVASAIWTCATDCSEVQGALLASGWLASLASVLETNPGHTGLLEAALGIVRSLSRNPAAKEEIMRLGFILAAIRGMRTFCDNAVLLKEACGVFGNLATDPDIRARLGQSGVIEEVVAALAKCQTHDDRKAAKLALGALANLSSCEANRDVLAACDAVPVLLGSAQAFMHNENILEYAISVIGHLAIHDIAVQQLIQAGAVEALLLFLGEHRDDLQVVSRSLVALRRLLRHSLTLNMDSHEVPPVVRQISCAGLPSGTRGVSLLVDALQAHVYDETVVKESALLLAGLSRVSSNVPALMAVAVAPCMKAMEVHRNDAAASDALAALLALLPLEEDERWSKFDQ